MPCDCGQPLENSLYVFAGRQLLKSCASCSRLLGEHVYHDVSEFGINHNRPLLDGSPTVQSHCRRSYGERVRVDTRPLADDFQSAMDKFLIDGTSCREASSHEAPRPAANDLAIREHLIALDDRAFDAGRSYLVGDAVRHPEHGAGRVEVVSADRLIIKFGKAYKQFPRTKEVT